MKSTEIPVKNRKLLGFLANSVLIASLLPYLSPFPLTGIDAQPTPVIIAVLALLLLLLIAPQRLNLVKTDAVLLGLGVLMLFYVDFSRTEVSLTWLRTCGTLLIAFPIYYAVRILYPFMSPKVFIGVVVAYVAVLILQITLPNVYLAIFTPLLSEIRWDQGIRGPNGLCVEPSMLGNMALVFILAMFFFKAKHWKEHPAVRNFVVASSILLLIISQSASGIVLALLVALVGLFFSRRSWLFKGAVVGILMLGMISAGALFRNASGRGAAFIAAVAQNPLVVVQDASFALRSIGTYLAFYALKEAPLGTGTLQFDQTLTDKAWESSLMLRLWPDEEMRQFFRDFVLERSSGIGPSLQRMGVLFVFILGTLLFLVRGFPQVVVVRLFLLAMLLNASLFTSTIWFVLGCCTAIWLERAPQPDEAQAGPDNLEARRQTAR